MTDPDRDPGDDPDHGTREERWSGGAADGGDAEPFRTVPKRASAAFEVRGSEFVGYVAPIEGGDGAEDAAEAFVDEVGAEHPDATHVVPAYRVLTGEGYLREYQSDGAEPAGSAGKPALGVLQRCDLENVAVAIARYYGGTNLGIGGLVSAYGRAASEAVDAAGVVERRPRERFVATVDYDDSGAVRSVLESEDADFEAAYEAQVTFAVVVPVAAADELRDRLRSATSGRVELSE